MSVLDQPLAWVKPLRMGLALVIAIGFFLVFQDQLTEVPSLLLGPSLLGLIASCDRAPFRSDGVRRKAAMLLCIGVLTVNLYARVRLSNLFSESASVTVVVLVVFIGPVLLCMLWAGETSRKLLRVMFFPWFLLCERALDL